MPTIPCPECGTYSRTHVAGCSKDVTSKEQRLEPMRRELARMKERVETLTKQIENIENEPEDVYENGTYLILETSAGVGRRKLVQLVYKVGDCWFRIGGVPINWLEVLHLVNNRFDVTVLRVTELSEESLGG